MDTLDKIKGALFGVAIGDALGATTEFMSAKEIKQEFGKVTEIIGGGWLDLEPGDITDDTEMTIAVAKGIISDPANPIPYIGEEFLKWYATNPKDVGATTRSALNTYIFERDWGLAARIAHKEMGGKSGGNGTLMRCLPIALAYKDGKEIVQYTIEQSTMTHLDRTAAVVCSIYNAAVSNILDGKTLAEALVEMRNSTNVAKLLKLSTDIPDVDPTGYVIDTFKWVYHILASSTSFEEVVQKAANYGGDSDTIGAIAGGLAGLDCGFNALPKRYVDAILIKDELLKLADDLYKVRESI